MIKSLLKVLAVFLFMATVVSVPLTAHTETEIGTASLDYLSALVSSLSKIVSSLASSVASLVNPSSQLAQVAPTDGLVAHWTFDKGSGTIAEDSAGSNTGILTNGPVWVEGKIGSGALQFDGVNDSVNAGHGSSLDITGPMTVSMWIYYSGNYNRSVTAPNSSLKRNQWQHVVYQFDGVQPVIYVDNIKTTGTAFTPMSSAPSSDVNIGIGPGVNYFAGSIDDVRIYNRALTASEISELYALGGSPPSSGGTNQAPTVSAGSSQTITLPATAILAGAVSDDGLPAGSSLTNTWSRVSGPGAVTFSNPNSLSATATFSSAGSYVLQLSSSDTVLTSTANVTITVNAAPQQGDPASPSIISSSPSGSLAANTTSTTLQVTTNESATCKYGTTPNTAYASMANNFSTTGNTTHSTSNLQNGQSYTYYAKCQDTAGNYQTADTIISFSVRTPAVLPPNAQAIGSEALVELPTSALGSRMINFKPGDVETIDLNPPVFSWLYRPDPAQTTDQKPYVFIFQIANNVDFQNPVVNVLTRSNAYNMLAPLPNANPPTTYYWRIGYIVDSMMASNIPNGFPLEQVSSTESSLINSFLPQAVWSGTRTFNIAAGVTTWDRSMLTDDDSLNSKKHPRLIFPQGESAMADFRAYAMASPTFTKMKNAVDNYIKNTTYWNSVWSHEGMTFTATKSANIGLLAEVAFVWQVTRDPKYMENLNPPPQELLVTAAQTWISSGYVFGDPGSSGHGQSFEDVGFAYDWLYNVMDDSQRKEVAGAIGLLSKYAMFSFAFSSPLVGRSSDDKPALGLYPNGRRVTSVQYSSESHTNSGVGFALVAAMAAYSEDIWARRLLALTLDLMTGRPMWNGTEDVDGGGSYVHLYMAPLLAKIFRIHTVFPESNFQYNPYLKASVDWWSRIKPAATETELFPWGDHYRQVTNYWTMFGYPLALLSQERLALEHYQAQKSIDSTFNFYGFGGNVEVLALEYYRDRGHLPEPSSSVPPTRPLAKAFPLNGWAMGCSYQSYDPRCFKEGVGFIFASRPKGPIGSHAANVDMSFELWAYGQTITQNGSTGNWYNGKKSENRNSLLINGVGPAAYSSSAIYGRLIAFATSANGVLVPYAYVAGEGKRLYQYWPSGTQRVGVRKASRQLLMVRGK